MNVCRETQAATSAYLNLPRRPIAQARREAMPRWGRINAITIADEHAEEVMQIETEAYINLARQARG